jgi:tRNA wybutosine-synthesizing protein 1
VHGHSLKIYYGTQTGTAKVFADKLAAAAETRGIAVAVNDLKDCDPEDTLTQEVRGIGNALLK